MNPHIQGIIKNRRIFLHIAIIVFLFSSCNKDNEPATENEFLVSQSLVLTYPLVTIQSAIALQAGEYPEASQILERVQYGVQVFRVNYKTHFKDSVITASGLACVPVSEGSFPVISFQNGTNAYHADAPSVNPASSGYVVMEVMASNGYIVLLPDYIGFGASSDILHPYYHRESTNNAVIDLIKAFQEMSESGKISASGNDSLFLMGYSQGGEATVSAADVIENDDLVDMNLIAVSGGAGAYDLMDFTNYILGLETFPSPMYFPYFIYSQQQSGFITGSLDLFFKQPYEDDIPGLFNGSYENNEINDALSNEISELLTENLRNNFASGGEFAELRDALTSNSIDGWNTSVNIRLYHGTLDDNVPPQQSLNLYNEFMTAGSDADKVRHFPMEGLSHGTGLFPWGIQTINWFNSLRN